MSNKLLEVLDRRFEHVKFDAEFIKKLQLFKINWTSKSEQYIDFISSPLIGVYRVRFSTRDEFDFFKNLLGIYQEGLQDDIKRTREIPSNFQVAINSFNVACIYIVHRFCKDGLNDKLLEQGIQEIYHILSLRMLGSIFSHFFKYDVELALAQSAYQNLSNKYLIKKEGSWERVLVIMARVLYPKSLDPKSVHHDRLLHFDANNYIRIINDINTRLRSVVKNYASEIYTLNDSTDPTSKINTSTLLQDTEDGEGLKDFTLGVNSQVNYLKNIIPSPNDFVNPAKVNLICNIMGNINKDKFSKFLFYLSEYHPVPTKNEIDYLTVCIKQSAGYLQTRGIVSDYNKRIFECLKLLKKYFSASKVKVDEINKTKDLLTKYVKEALKDEKNWLAPPLVIGAILYIYLISIKS